MENNKIYITNAIAYVNGSPHMGHALEFTQADVFARFCRSKNKEVFFLSGADEHGSKMVQAAASANKSVQELVNENSEKFLELQKIYNLSWDNFIRTSDKKKHWPVVIDLWNKLVEAGDLYKKSYKGLYCVGHEAFVTQKDLIDGKCFLHKQAPQEIEEENWFFRLSKYGDRIKEKILSGEFKVCPESRRNEILSIIEEGLEDISFSRPAKNLSWGIPVPNDKDQTIYVWADALSNYISGYGGINAWEKHPADVHFIGKDILRFHAAIWPAMLLSAGLSMPKSLFVHGFITVKGEKMSKSLGNVVDPVELVKKYGVDAVRYYLLREIPSAEDGDFSYEKFEARYNGDLANGLGNFAARVLTLGANLSKISNGEIDAVVAKKINDLTQASEEKTANFKFNEALVNIWELVQFGNQYVSDNKPWDKSLSETEKEKIIFNALNIVRAVADLIKPFLPETSEKISDCIKYENNILEIKKSSEILFPRIAIQNDI